MEESKEGNKNIDESWKEKAEQDKKADEILHKSPEQEIYHKPDFNFFVSTMSMQALIALGKLENPLTAKAEKNLNQARFIIDTLDIIKEKTAGNLTKEEGEFLENILSDLKMVYAQEANI